MSEVPGSAKSFHSPRWVIISCGCAPLLFGTASYSIYSREGVSWLVVVSAAIAAFGIIAFADAFLTRVILHDRELEVFSNFRSRSYPRSMFESVSWAKGAPVALKVRDGGWVKLPPVGNGEQGLINSIRAWLRHDA